MKTRTIFCVFLLVLGLSGCVKDDLRQQGEESTPQALMEDLNIADPSIWNSMVVQSIDLDAASDKSLKSASVASIQEYPKGEKYYFALFEDLFPAEGDYDFNDIIIQSKLGLSKSGKTVTGFLRSKLHNKGGSRAVEIGLMFYEVSGKKYTRIANEKIMVNGERLKAGERPWSVSQETLGDSWQIDFEFENASANVWINYFIYTDREIFTGGFAPSETESFTLPDSYFLTDNNLPWGLEIEAESFAIPNEKECFLLAYPEFKDWAESGGIKNKKWYQNPDTKYTHN